MLDATNVPTDLTLQPDLGYDPEVAPPSGATADPVPPEVVVPPVTSPPEPDVNTPGTTEGPTPE